MKKVWLIVMMVLIVILFSPDLLPGAKVVALEEIMKPVILQVDDTQMYITEGATVYIYSLRDYKLVAKFGREGQGPQEFQIHPRAPMTIDVRGENILINSIGKISYFTKGGKFLREVKAKSQAFYLQVFGDGFIGRTQKQENQKVFDVVNLYDGAINLVKELYSMESSFQGPGQGGLKVLGKVFAYQTYKGRVLLPGGDDATVDVYGEDLNKIFSITLDQEKRKVDQEFKDQVIRFLQTEPSTKDIFEILKPIVFPEYFPVIAAFFAVDDTIYVMTWKREPAGNEFFTYDMQGKFLRRMVIPIQYENSLRPYPITLSKGILYQIVENQEEEVWELHINKIQ